jgi:hypothetical protein
MSRFSLLVSGLHGFLFFQPEGRVNESFILTSLFVELTDGFFFPMFLFDLDLLHKLGYNSSVLGILVFDELLDVGEAPDSVHDEKVVHNVRVISLQWSTIWTNKNFPDTIKLLEFIIIVIAFLFFAFFFSRPPR